MKLQNREIEDIIDLLDEMIVSFLDERIQQLIDFGNASEVHSSVTLCPIAAPTN